MSNKHWMIKEVSFINVTRQMGPEVEVLSEEIDLDTGSMGSSGRVKVERVALSDEIIREIVADEPTQYHVCPFPISCGVPR